MTRWLWCCILAACNPAGAAPLGDATAALGGQLVVDARLRPARDALTPRHGRHRAVARVADAHGNAADFVTDELLVAAEDASVVDGLVARRSGEVLDVFALSTGPFFFVVRVDPRTGDPSRLALPRPHRVSSDDGLRLLAIAAAETEDHGLVLSANWLLTPAMAAKEAPAGPAGYRRDALSWPYLRDGGAQDAGVVEAWRLLHRARRLDHRVSLLVVDGGFVRSRDLAPGARLLGGEWSTPSATPCTGGQACPWHGTQVAAAAVALPANGFGAAGPGGPVVDPILVQAPDADVADRLRLVFDETPRALGFLPRIVNVSATVRVPTLVCGFACPAAEAATTTLRRENVLVFAAAGNNALDVDAEECHGDTCRESVTVIPCELEGVECVGGLDWDRVTRAPGSNFGRPRGGSIDLYGPYDVYGPVPLADGSAVPNRVARLRGTSFSAPFVAGCAALVMAARPELDAGAVASLLRATAHTGSPDEAVVRWLDCAAAVRRALAR